MWGVRFRVWAEGGGSTGGLIRVSFSELSRYPFLEDYGILAELSLH